MGHDLESYMEYFSEYKNEELIQMVTFNRWFMDEVQLEAVEKTLLAREVNVFYNEEMFIHDFLTCVEDGWVPQVELMFQELIDFGWNYSIPIKSKEKYGDFICDIYTDNQELVEIVRKYRNRINGTCSICGSNERVINDQSDFWIVKICKRCRLKGKQSYLI